jgi:hypothetical protein
VPWESRTHFDDDRLRIERDDHESARLVIPWNVDSQGDLTLSSGTLIERDEPYHLALEIARGTLFRIRNQVAYWQAHGLVVPDSLASRLNRATDCFIDAAIRSGRPQDMREPANRAISESIACLPELIDSFVKLCSAKDDGANGTWYGSVVDTGQNELDQRGRASTAVVPFRWKHVEANQNEFDWSAIEKTVQRCRRKDLRIFGGNLFDLGAESLPDWLYLWQDDDDALESFVARYTMAVVGQFRQKVNVWQCHISCNTDPGMMLTEEQRLRLAVRAIEAVRHADSQGSLVVVMDQPWCESMVRQTSDLTPIQLADMLCRSELDVTGFGLQFRFGTTLSDTLCRDALEFGRLIDIWSLLGKPLFVHLESKMSTPSPLFDETMRSILSLLKTKRAVHGIIWDDSVSRLRP